MLSTRLAKYLNVSEQRLIQHGKAAQAAQIALRRIRRLHKMQLVLYLSGGVLGFAALGRSYSVYFQGQAVAHIAVLTAVGSILSVAVALRTRRELAGVIEELRELQLSKGHA